jgi:large subunit ribosomal protein L24e
LHKKGLTEEASKKKSRKTVKVQRAVVGADLDAIAAKKNMKPEVRAAQREQLIKSIKDKKKTEQEKKKVEKQKAQAQQRLAAPKPKVSKQQAKGSAPKVQAKSR